MLDQVYSRVDPLIKYCAGKTVLTIGCCGMGCNDIYGGKDFHLTRLRQIAKKVVGVDIRADEIAKLNKLGYNIFNQSADESFAIMHDKPQMLLRKDEVTDIAIKRCMKFDVVMGEEIQEHLQDLRVFLTNVKRHMKSNGTFIVTTPNVFAWSYMTQRILYGKELTNDYHTHWYSEKTMRYLLKSNGFEIINYRIIQAESENLRGKIFQMFAQFLPKRFGINMIFVCKLKKSKK